MTTDASNIVSQFMGSGLQSKVDMVMRLRDVYAMTYNVPDGGEYGFAMTGTGAVFHQVRYPVLDFNIPVFFQIWASYHTHPSGKDYNNAMFSSADILNFSESPNGSIAILEASGLTYVLSMDNRQKINSWLNSFDAHSTQTLLERMQSTFDRLSGRSTSTPFPKQSMMESAMAKLLQDSGISIYRKNERQLKKIEP